MGGGVGAVVRSRKGEVQLDMQDMILYHIQTMEERRR